MRLRPVAFGAVATALALVTGCCHTHCRESCAPPVAVAPAPCCNPAVPAAPAPAAAYSIPVAPACCGSP